MESGCSSGLLRRKSAGPSTALFARSANSFAQDDNFDSVIELLDRVGGCMGFRTIVVAEADGIRTITLNRPERRNAMTPEMQDELLAAMQEAAAGACRVVVFAGAGEPFCAGLDLSVLQQMNDKPEAEHRADAERVARLFRTLYELPKPTIAAVHGAAVAGGTGLATICDFTLAAEGAKFGYTEVK